MAVRTITISGSSWTLSPSSFYYDTLTSEFYADSAVTTPIKSIALPTRKNWRCDGLYDSASGEIQYVDAGGNITGDLYALMESATSNKTIYVQGTLVSRTVTLDDGTLGDGGSPGMGEVFYRIDGGGFYVDYLCVSAPLESVTKPYKSGTVFKGYFSSSSGGTRYVTPDGGFEQGWTPTANVTVYAQFVAPYKITVGGTTGRADGDKAFYYESVSGNFTSDAAGTERIASIAMHSRESYAPAGCYSSNNTTSTLRVAPDGTIATDWTPTAATTIYCQWTQASYKITISANSGSGGTARLFYRIGGGGVYGPDDDLCVGAPVASIVPPVRSGYLPSGLFSSSSGANPVQYTEPDGTVRAELSGIALTGNKTLYWRWVSAKKITFNANSGTLATQYLYFSSNVFYADDYGQNPVTAITIPTREFYRFDGFYSSASGSATQYIDADGAILPALADYATQNRTIYARWTRVSYALDLRPNGGEGETVRIYFDGTTEAYYSDWLLTDQLGRTLPANKIHSRTGYTLLGYYESTSGGSRLIDGNGEIVDGGYVVQQSNKTIYARWSANTYTLTFDYGNGAGSPSSMTVTYDSPVGNLPSPTISRGAFVGWFVDDSPVVAGTVWNVAADAVAVARYQMFFSGPIDYFGLASAALKVVASDSGDGYQRDAVAHSGRFASGVTATSRGIWRNPSVTYAVTANTTVAVQLGKAFAATRSGSIMTVSGYMITSVEIRTEAGTFPTVTVSATANEGADAINKWTVSVPVLARSKAQNLLNAVNGGGALKSLTLTACADPVVLAESPAPIGATPYNKMPCASDIVNGRYEVSGETTAVAGEDAPTAGNGFALLSAPMAGRNAGYLTYSFDMRKEMT